MKTMERGTNSDYEMKTANFFAELPARLSEALARDEQIGNEIADLERQHAQKVAELKAEQDKVRSDATKFQAMQDAIGLPSPKQTGKKLDGRSKEARALKAKQAAKAVPVKVEKKLDGRSKEARALKAAQTPKKLDGRSKEARALKAKQASKAKIVPAKVEKKLDGRSKEARALKAKQAAKVAPKQAPKKAKKLDGRSKEARALKAAQTPKKLDGRSKEARALKAKQGSAGKKVNGRAKEAKTSKSTKASAKKLDGRSKEARAAKAAKQASALDKKVQAEKKLDGRSKEARALKAKKAPAQSAPLASNVAAGRRAVARGDRPPMKEAIALIMGDKETEIGEVVAALEKKGWLPNTPHPRPYVNCFLANSKDVFERVSRGKYKVIVPSLKKEKAQSTNSAATPAATPAPAAKKSGNNVGKSNKNLDEDVRNFMTSKDGNVMPNPFNS